VLFLSAADLTGQNPDHTVQAFLIEFSGSGLRQITSAPEGVADAVLSGDGVVVLATTESGRIHRIDVESGAVQEIVSRTPVYGFCSYYNVPGSAAWICGTGLAEEGRAASGFPLPEELEGVQVKIGGIQTPLISVSPRLIRFQVPWEARGGVAELISGNSIFEGEAQQVWIVGFGPTLEIRPCSAPAMWCPEIYHAESGTPVTGSDGARSGEELHLLVTGLGPVSPPLPSGMPGPAAVDRNMQCLLSYGVREIPVPVLATQFVAETVGLYRMAIRLPEDIRSERPFLFCGGGPTLAEMFSVSLPMQR
jgi:uncharacterized protein (TIGR03437 family)